MPTTYRPAGHDMPAEPARRNDATQKMAKQELGVPLHDETAAQICRGWNDYRDSAERPAIYEKSEEHVQRNYEMGRSLAAAVARVGELPPWPPSLTYGKLVEHGLLTSEMHEIVMEEYGFHMKGAKKPT